MRLFRQGKYAETEPLYKRLLGIKEKALGLEHPDVATSLKFLAALYRLKASYAQAAKLESRAKAIRIIVNPDPTLISPRFDRLTALRFSKRRNFP